MPIYEYECPRCKRVKEELRSISDDRIDIACDPCVSCLEPMKRVISLVVGKVRGGTPKLTTTRIDKNVSKE
jgi:putative FmdB family regulatory protein